MHIDDPRAVKRVEDLRFLRGRGTFIDDLPGAGLSHAAIVRAQVAHGVIRSIDVAAARAAPGVHAVLTAEDLGDPIPVLPLRLAPIAGVERFLQPPIARDKVRYVGEVLAIVLAESRALAEDAADLVVVDIDPLPAIVDSAGAERGEVILQEDRGTNIAARYTVGKGDAAAAFASADFTCKEMFHCHRMTASPLETRGLIARWDEAGERLKLEGTAKVPHTARKFLAQMLGVPIGSIEMVEHDNGGGFGVRGELHPEDFLIPAVARAAGRPVKWIEDRREHLMSANHSREMDCEVELACRKDGRIVGMRAKLWANMGAYIRPNGGVVPAKAAQFIVGPYDIENLEIEVAFALTNKTPMGTFRGPGRFETGFFRERIIDIAANELGIDPADLRRRNLVTAAQMPYVLGKLVPYEGEAVFDTGDFPAAFERALAEIDYDGLKALNGQMIDGRYHGVAATACVENSGPGPRENARMRLSPKGVIEIHIGSSNMGQGLETIFSQIAADAMRLPIEAFEVFHGSTTHLAEGMGTYASRAVVMGGSTVLITARKLEAELKAFAAEIGVNSPELSVEMLRHLIAEANARGRKLDVEGVFENNKLTYSSGAHAAHVAVDPRTGHVEVIDYVAIEDVGRAINPALVHGQAIGGLVQGLGGAFLDHLVYDADGQLLTASFADYLLPTASDFPNVRAVTLEDHPSPSNPLGAKGAGEGPIVNVGGTIGNAIAAALRPLSVRINTMPFSPPRIFSVINEAKRSS